MAASWSIVLPENLGGVAIAEGGAFLTGDKRLMTEGEMITWLELEEEMDMG